eukprot:2405383-Alexandrium_andersonii.AAC.1
MPARRQCWSMASQASAKAASRIAAWAAPRGQGVGGSLRPRRASNCLAAAWAPGTAIAFPSTWNPTVSHSGRCSCERTKPCNAA